tara:strand:+ start:197 stop:334 length:138 start_codon:yes stop_codon:yes gene_type:complete
MYIRKWKYEWGLGKRRGLWGGGGVKGEGGLPSTPILTIYKKVVNI